ncbi:hypothetical protein EB796_021901 [Bugula neritina]|uniref:NAD(P)-binding domain-containing protein n=1 Tax=Bugula neritina TaxID=10212 RepID=A0A7J7J2A7_BUGNE|nr:hypothetical protein EB796_021901 [Bugula neritina]
MATKPLKIVLFGATGNSGLQVIQQAIERGHSVKALVRTPHKVEMQHQNLKVVKTNIYDAEALSSELKDCDLVLSCLGIRGKMPSGTSFYIDTMRSITTAMRKTNVKRMIAMSSWGTYRHPSSSCFIDYGFRFIIARVLDSMREMELFLEHDCQDLDFTVVRPAGLTDHPVTDKEFKVEVDCPCVPQGWCGSNFSIPRADVARFMLDTAESYSFPKTCLSIMT